MPTTLVQV